MKRMRQVLVALVAALVVVVGAGPALAGTTATSVPTAVVSAVDVDGCRQVSEGYAAPGACQLVIAQAQAVCVADTPTLNYAVVPEGTPNQTVTITWINPDGPDVVQSGLPLTGSVLWPGTVVENGVTVDWPGWTRQADGTLTQGDEYDWTRAASVQVLFEVNPSATTSVSYPPATPACGGPKSEVLSVADPGDPGDPADPADPAVSGTTSGVLAAAQVQSAGFASAVLAATGLSTGPALAVGGGLLLLGVLLVVVAARRRHRHPHHAA